MLTLFFLLTGIFNVDRTLAEAPAPPSGLDYRIDAFGSYFKTTSNYTAGGGSSGLRNGGQFTDITGGVIYTQDLDAEKRVYGGLTFSSTESYDGMFTRDNSGFNEVWAGGQYWTDLFGYKFGPSLDFVYPLVRVDRNEDDALLGEGAMKIRAGGWALFGDHTWIPFSYLGYEYRDEGRSHAIPYSIGIKWRAHPMWVQLEYRGYERLFSNSDTVNRGPRDTFLQRVDGGSYRYYAINSAVSEVAVELGRWFGSFGLYGGVATTVRGASAAQGWTGLIGLSYSPPGNVGSAGPSDEYERINTPDSESDRFTPKVDPFDEFDPTKPPKNQSAKKIKKPTSTKPSKRTQDKVDKLLNDAEKNLNNL